MHDFQSVNMNLHFFAFTSSVTNVVFNYTDSYIDFLTVYYKSSYVYYTTKQRIL